MSFVSLKVNWPHKYLYSFNGATFKTEPSSNFPHYYAMALGSYRNSPFVTGQDSSTNGLKTEILNYEEQNWQQVADYPFSNSNRYDNRMTQQNLSLKTMFFYKMVITITNLNIKFISEYHIIPLLQPVKVFWSSAALHMVHQMYINQPLPNSKTGTGKMLETWLKLDVFMVQSHQGLS